MSELEISLGNKEHYTSISTIYKYLEALTLAITKHRQGAGGGMSSVIV